MENEVFIHFYTMTRLSDRKETVIGLRIQIASFITTLIAYKHDTISV